MLLLLLVSLFPFAVYLFALAGLNRRERPALVHGIWETLGLLFAFSGFLLYSGPLLFKEYYIRDLLEIPIGEGTAEVFEETYQKWLLLWGAYYVGLLALAGGLLLGRRNVRGVYNVDPGQFRLVLAQTVEEKGLSARLQGNTLFLFHGRADAAPVLAQPDTVQAEEPSFRVGLPDQPGPDSPEQTGIQAELPPRAEVPPAPEPLPPGISSSLAGELTVDAFPALCHITLSWGQGEKAFRRDFETALEKNLEPAAAADNPTANWFLGAASLLFGALFMLLAMWIFSFLFPRRIR